MEPTATCLARSTSVRYSPFPMRRQQKSPTGLPNGCGRSTERRSRLRSAGSGFPFPSPAEQAQRANAGGKKRQARRKRRWTDVHIVKAEETGIIAEVECQGRIGPCRNYGKREKCIEA